MIYKIFNKNSIVKKYNLFDEIQLHFIFGTIYENL